MRTLSLLLILTVVGLCSGCNRTDPPQTPAKAAAATPVGTEQRAAAATPKLIGPVLTAKAQYRQGERIDVRLAFDSINWGVQDGVDWDAEDQNQHWKYWFVRINGQEKQFSFVLAPSRALATTFDIQKEFRTELPPGRYRMEYVARDLPVVLRDEPHTRLVPKEIASNEIGFEIIPAARPDTQSATQRSSR